jgi:hypothetical protein
VSGGASLVELDVADEPAGWAALGFAVADDGGIELGGVRLAARGRAAGTGIVAAGLAGAAREPGVDGLVLRAAAHRDDVAAQPAVPHPNGALAVDHVVVTTPALEHTAAALQRAGLDLRRTRDVAGDRPLRQAFLLAGPCLVEVVGPPGDRPAGPASFWGLTLVVEDLDALAARLGSRLGAPRDAVQPGRRIATLRREAGLSSPVAFMTPRVRSRGEAPAS